MTALYFDWPAIRNRHFVIWRGREGWLGGGGGGGGAPPPIISIPAVRSKDQKRGHRNIRKPKNPLMDGQHPQLCSRGDMPPSPKWGGGDWARSSTTHGVITCA